MLHPEGAHLVDEGEVETTHLGEVEAGAVLARGGPRTDEQIGDRLRADLVEFVDDPQRAATSSSPSPA